jgi:IS5 family transposase
MKQEQLFTFDEEEVLGKLSALGDPLEKLNEHIDWEIFRPAIKKCFKKQAKKEGGRPPYDYILMFKITVLQKLYGLSDDKTEYMINDRLSFHRFLGLHLSDSVPDAKTIWVFKDTLAKKGTAEKLDKLFTSKLGNEKLITHKRSLVDATFVDIPRPRNTREENKQIKEGQTPESFKVKKDENGEVVQTKENLATAHKVAQKDTDARWTKKNNETHCGYKDHVKVDSTNKFIVKSVVTDASVHDSQEIAALTDKNDKNLYADSAYVGEPIEKAIHEKNTDVKLHICEKGKRGHPLTDKQKANNRKKSKTRCRVEHVFGFMTNTMNALTIRCIGMVRAKSAIVLTNLVYNLCRYCYIKRKGRPA